MNKIHFLGTAGARFAVTRQIRKSGGIWVTLDNKNFLIDPGPGSLLRCLSTSPKLNPHDLDAILLSHRHIDHSNDVNIMIEAMTNGGRVKKGVVFAPSDALDTDPVILHHFRNHVEKIITLTEGATHSIGSVTISTPIKHVHDVETFGYVFHGSKHSISYISDTQYFHGIESYYNSDVIIINVVLVESTEYINHLSISDVEHIIHKIKPKMTILTHFGLTMIEEKPWHIAESLTQQTGHRVIAATDDFHISLDEIDVI